MTVQPVTFKPAGSPGVERPPWWRREPLSIIELADALHVARHGREGFDPERTVARMRDLNATAAHIHPLGCHLDGRTLFFRHSSPGDPPPEFDYVAEWLEHSIPAGLRTIIYINVHSVKLDFARRHPDWQHRLADGSPKENVYNIESAFCVNSPWREWVFARLRELCAYRIDGIFFDGPVFFDDDCYCPYCKGKFEVRHGTQMPPRDALAHPDFPALIEFQADSLCDFLLDSRSVIREAGGDILFYVNANPLYPSRINARCNRKLAACQDILAAEGGFLGRDLMTDAPLWKVGMNAKYLETQSSAAGVPHLVFDCTTHTPWTSYSLPAAETTLLWASSVANGAGTWMSCYKDATDRPGVRAIGPCFTRARRWRRELFETRSLADVALLASDATFNYYAGADVPQTDFSRAARSDEVPNATQELYGWYHALWSAQVPFDLLDDFAIEEQPLDHYRLVILPNSACLSDRCVNRLVSFVAAGGSVVASFETGVFDAQGRRRINPALDEILGIRRTDSSVDPPRLWDYLFDHRHAGRPADRSGCIPSPAYALHVTASESARVLMTFSRPLADRFADLAEDAGRPAVIERRHRAGGRAVYFACDFGAALQQYRLPEHLELVRELVWQLARPLVRFDNSPPCLEVSLRAQPDSEDLFLHLVNYNGGMTRPIQRVLPIHDLAIWVRDSGSVCAARTLFGDTEVLGLGRQDGWIGFRLPVLHEYEIVQIENAFAAAARH